MGRKPPRRSPLLHRQPRVFARPRPRRRLRHKLTSVQLWAAIAGIIGSLAAVPALIISMNALKISEGQRADALKISEKQQAEARQAKAATDLANETAFAQRVTLEPDDITSIILSGGTFTITNANTLSTEVQTRIWFSKAAGPDAYRMATFAAPACSQTTYRIGPTEREVLKVTDIDNLEDSSTLTSIAVYNPIGQRLWSTGMSGIPLKPEDLSEFGSMNSPLFENPTTRRALTGCV